MKSFIVDTDIGADADDVVALAYLLGKCREGTCTLRAITLSTARAAAPACVRAVLRGFAATGIPVGAYSGAPLACDRFDLYAREIAERYGEPVTGSEEAVPLLRRTLATAEGRTDLIAIGPLSNLSALLQSGADAASPLDGAALVREKAGTLYVMGGLFREENPPRREWNVLQDIPAAQVVADRFPRPVIYCPSETGGAVTTYAAGLCGVVYDALRCFSDRSAENDGTPRLPEGSYTRPSWDPLTAMVAMEEQVNFVFSPSGRVTIAPDGTSTFAPMPGGIHRVLRCESDLAAAEGLLRTNLLRFCGTKNTVPPGGNGI